MAAQTCTHPFRASEHASDGNFHLLLAASGSVATIKIPNIIQGLANTPNISIRVLCTRSATEFLQGQSAEQPTLAEIARMPNVAGVHVDDDEWNPPWIRNASILHIELRRWANLLVIAPLSANTLAKIANGLCDNLLTSVVRAWEVVSIAGQQEQPQQGAGKANAIASIRDQQKLILVAPSMNTAMWNHPLTAQHLSQMGQDSMMHWIRVLSPIEKTIACGDTGNGAMREWKDIVGRILELKEQFLASVERARLDGSV